ncbi:ParA family protein [Nannocystis punicea]|uniref:ParA family protein n=1 Tax=Nannocystis punicea TaxID=2995304 RepID=A0ABY7H6X5_9BACT|nr:ParA family protein [Nannocystis poenicansa]WAS95025.1 ParA family protein [Nannocystis poenicansa]
MKTIVVYNNKGGIGKTTFSVHLALFASERRIRTLVVGLDRQGDICRWLSGGDEHLMNGHFFRVNECLQVLYSPMELPQDLANFDLVVADCPPHVEVVDQVDADLWLVPIDGRLAMENMGNVYSALRRAEGTILIVLNRCDLIGKRALEGLREAAHQIPQATVRDEPIPSSAAIAKASEYFRPVWKVPYGKDTQGDRAMQAMCGDVLKMCGFEGRL